MGDILQHKEKTIRRIERLGAIFAMATSLPAQRALNLRRVAEPMKLHNSKLLPQDHIIQQIADDLAAPLGVKVQIEVADPEKKLYSAFTYATERKNSIGDIREVRIVFLGNPLKSFDPDLMSRGIIAHELGHIQQMNSPTFTCNRANMHVSVLITLGCAGLSALVPALLPATATAAALTFALTAFNQLEERCNEFLADLRGAKILGSHIDMARALAYMEDMSITEYEKTFKDKKPTIISRIFNHSAFSGHPPVEKRIETLLKQDEYLQQTAANQSPKL